MNTPNHAPAQLRTDLDPDHQRRRADFARSAVWANFRHRDARALDFNGFVDREPWERPLTAKEAER